MSDQIPNLFLVLLRLTMDDVPLAIFYDREEALQFIEDEIPAGGSVPDWVPRIVDLGWTTPINAAIAFFEEGRLIGLTIVREFEQDYDDEPDSDEEDDE